MHRSEVIDKNGKKQTEYNETDKKTDGQEKDKDRYQGVTHIQTVRQRKTKRICIATNL